MNTYFLEKLSYIHSSSSRSSPHAVLVALCASRYTCCRYRVQARSKTWTGFSVMWAFSIRTSGMVTDTLKGLSLPYTMKWRETDRFMIIFKWIMTGYMIIYLNPSGHSILNLSVLFCKKNKTKQIKIGLMTPLDVTVLQPCKGEITTSRQQFKVQTHPCYFYHFGHVWLFTI